MAAQAPLSDPVITRDNGSLRYAPVSPAPDARWSFFWCPSDGEPIAVGSSVPCKATIETIAEVFRNNPDDAVQLLCEGEIAAVNGLTALPQVPLLSFQDSLTHLNVIPITTGEWRICSRPGGELSLEVLRSKATDRDGREIESVLYVGNCESNNVPLEECNANVTLLAAASRLYDVVLRMLSCVEANKPIDKVLTFYASDTLMQATYFKRKDG